MRYEQTRVTCSLYVILSNVPGALAVPSCCSSINHAHSNLLSADRGDGTSRQQKSLKKLQTFQYLAKVVFTVSHDNNPMNTVPNTDNPVAFSACASWGVADPTRPVLQHHTLCLVAST